MINEVFTRLGRIVKVNNIKTKAFSNENPSYLCVWVKDADGSNPRCLLFTENEIAKAEMRAFKNTEDLTQRSVVSKLLD